MKKIFAVFTFGVLISLMLLLVGCDLTVDQTTAHVHAHVEEITKDPTCTEEGVKTFTCTCGDSYTEAIAKVPHTEETLEAVAPTCTETGLTEGKQCSVCGTVTVPQDTVPENGHIPADTLTKDDTQHWHACTVCGEKTDATAHVYANACDADCNECGATRTPADHIYDNDCDADCNECGTTRTPADHIYDNDCDADCNECGVTRTPADHIYDNDCDADCNECGVTRTPADHIYDNDCDADCNECGATRTPADHIYDNACDADCNECGETRTPANHIYDNDCDADCNECGETRTPADHVYDNACDADCNECGETRTPADHIYDNACDADCNECGVTRTPADHIYDNACDADCNECGVTRTPADHIYDNACDTTCNECGAVRTVADHVYDHETDTTCNECGAVRVVAPVLYGPEVAKEHDLYDLDNKENLVIDFAENINNPSQLALAFSVKQGEDELILDGSVYTLALGSYDEHTAYLTFTVTVTCLVGEELQTLTYTYTLGLKDTGAYRVANSNFEKGLDGWTLTNTFGERPFGGIDDKTTFWGEGYAMFNQGKYFSAYAEGAEEFSHGMLASSYFLVNSQYATYMLGGGGNHHVYITVENKDGEVLALYRNTRFTDFPAGEYSLEDRRAMIGNTVFLANFVTFKVDMSAWMGQEVRFVVHDYASSGWGVVYFDELHTYYPAEDLIPENALVAENLLANKEALTAELSLEIAEQGDYTADSYNAYLEKLAEAKALVSDIAVTQETVDRATAALTAARLALTVRPIEEVADADTSFRMTSGDAKDILLSDLINTNGLSKITYAILANHAAVILGDIVDGKFTLTAGEVSESTTVTVTVTVSYDGVEKLTVELTVEISNELPPVVQQEEFVKEIDLYYLQNKESLILDLSENIDNAGNLALTYTVDGNVIDNAAYTFTFGAYNDQVTYETIVVTVSYTANGEAQTIQYTYKLALTDSTEYRLQNGGFENGLDGWNVVGNIGDVSDATHYWLNDPENADGFAFGLDGSFMFSAYAPGAFETAVGTLTSATFKVGGSGFVTFKIGAMRDENYVYIDVVDAETKQILARYYNGLWAERTNDAKSGCTLIAYKADLSAFMGREVFFRISDNADSGYGLFFADSFETYYANEPEGFNAATAVSYQLPGTIYDIFNGGFEMGNVQGWWNQGEPGHVTGADAFFSGVAYGKDGNFLYSGVEDHLAGNGKEGNRGALTSSVFEIGGVGYISFMLGGGGNALCYVQIIDAVTGEVLARYHQQEMQDAVLKLYVADLSAYIGRTVRVQVVDQADRDWGCVSFDNVITYYKDMESLPQGIVASDIKGELKYTVENGSFETGNLDGWNMYITEAGTHNTLGWVESAEHDAGWYAKNDETKDGTFLFTFTKPDGTNCENTKGTLESSTFSLKQGAFVAFKFGGAGGAQNHDVYIELCRADGSVIARFYNDAPGKVNTRMNAYFYQYQGAEVNCFFRVVDNSTGDYGCFVVDAFQVNLERAPEGYIAAIQ